MGFDGSLSDVETISDGFAEAFLGDEGEYVAFTG